MRWSCCHLPWSWLSVERESDFVDGCSLLEIRMEVIQGSEGLRRNFGGQSCSEEARYQEMSRTASGRRFQGERWGNCVC